MPRAPRTSMEDTSTNESFEEAVTPTARRSRRFNPFTRLTVRARRRPIQSILVVVALLGILGTAYFYQQYTRLRQNPNAVQEEEVAKLVKEVGQLMLLPDEAPTVATVLDTASLEGQPFFINAVNGDKVLVFVNARQAVLYRPSEQKIINVAPLYFQDEGASATGIEPATPETSETATTTDSEDVTGADESETNE